MIALCRSCTSSRSCTAVEIYLPGSRPTRTSSGPASDSVSLTPGSKLQPPLRQGRAMLMGRLPRSRASVLRAFTFSSTRAGARATLPAAGAQRRHLASRSTTSSGSGGSAVYETSRAVDEYIQFHYADGPDLLPYPVCAAPWQPAP
jgi:hypothetical protein